MRNAPWPGRGEGGGGSPRKIVWGCAAHFPKPFHFLKAHSFPRATPSENRSLLETDKVIMSADKHPRIPTVIRAKWRLFFISFIYINTCRFKAKNYSSRSHRSKTGLPLHLETVWQALGHTVVSKISLLQLTVFEALLSSLREWLLFLTLRRDPLKYLILFTKRRRQSAVP